MTATHIRKITAALATATAICAGSAYADEKISMDRSAILAMAGDYYVDFQFQETVAIDPDYELRRPYTSDASETIKVIKDTGECIILQHILWVPETGLVIKHWKQEWNFEDTILHEYVGDLTWKKRELTTEEAAGSWSQKVSQVDDSPRYESYGRWVHRENLSYWQSGSTRRPLPRREYRKRDDYNVLMCVNRHTLTPDGWIHEQDNYKQVAPGQKVLCREVGLNVYERTNKVDFTKANQYWKDTQEFWNAVSRGFDQALAENQSLSLRRDIAGIPLYKQLFKAADRSATGTDDPAPTTEAQEIIRKFVIQK